MNNEQCKTKYEKYGKDFLIFTIIILIIVIRYNSF